MNKATHTESTPVAAPISERVRPSWPGLPMLIPALISGGMLSFIVSMDNFIMSFFTAGPGSTTLPLYIWGSLRVGLTPEINALSTMILLASILVLVLSQVVTRKKG